MKMLARRFCYWKNIDLEIERLVKACKACAEVRKNPVPAPLHRWDEPAYNFQRIHMDYAGPFLGHHFLIVVDAKSKWPEIIPQTQPPTSASTIKRLEMIFTQHGIPESLVSDNAQIFKSDEFTQFCKQKNIDQRFTAPGKPSTNGLAERYVQILKNKLKAMLTEPGTIQQKVNEILLRFRATPLQCNKSPSQLYLNRQLRTELDFLKPATHKVNKSHKPPVSRFFQEGDRVQARNYLGTKLWKFGVITKVLGRLHYQVRLDDGYNIKRHLDQLRSCEVGKEETNTASEYCSYTSAPTPSSEHKQVTFKTPNIVQPTSPHFSHFSKSPDFKGCFTQQRCRTNQGNVSQQSSPPPNHSNSKKPESNEKSSVATPLKPTVATPQVSVSPSTSSTHTSTQRSQKTPTSSPVCITLDSPDDKQQSSQVTPASSQSAPQPVRRPVSSGSGGSSGQPTIGRGRGQYSQGDQMKSTRTRVVKPPARLNL